MIAKLIYADSEHSADMLYAVGVFVPDPFLWCRVGSEDIVVVSALEYGRLSSALAGKATVLSQEQARRQFGLRRRQPEALIAALTRDSRVKRWDVPASFPLQLAEKLARRKVRVRTVPGAFFPERETKSKQEVAYLTEGVRLAEAGLERALGILRESRIRGSAVVWQGQPLTAESLRGEINALISRLGGAALHTIVAPGRHGADPHDEGAGPIRPHEPIVIDIFPRVQQTGYYGDLTRTVVKGQAPEVVQRASAAVKKARDKAKSMIKPGADGKDIHAAVVKTLDDAGFATDAKADPPHGFFHGTGHGLGLEVHELPRLAGVKNVLKAGHVVTVEPGLYYPEWGGMRLEDVVVVTAKRYRTLTSVPDILEID